MFFKKIGKEESENVLMRMTKKKKERERGRRRKRKKERESEVGSYKVAPVAN